MRLVQKSMKHTGYVVLEVTRGTATQEILRPTFTDDPLFEGQEIAAAEKNYWNQVKIKSIDSVDVTCFSLDLINLSVLLKAYKEKDGIYPQNFTEELRTGFRTTDRLHQTLPRYMYK